MGDFGDIGSTNNLLEMRSDLVLKVLPLATAGM
jgi:hypothetical protein